MVRLYFGLPRSGKTTLIAKMARQYSRRYDYVYTNVHLSNMPDNVRFIDDDKIGVIDVSNSLLLIDEASIGFDNRDWKKFTGNVRNFFLLHGHYRCNIFMFTQKWDGIDSKIRSICEEVYYVFKPKIIGKIFTFYYKIPYGIIIPDRKHNKDSTGNTLGEIIQGYCKPSIFRRLFPCVVLRPLYYRNFNSYEAPLLDPYEKYYG